MNGQNKLALAMSMAMAAQSVGDFTPSSYGDLVPREMPFKYTSSNYGSGRSNRTAGTRVLDVSKRNAKRRAQRKARRNNR